MTAYPGEPDYQPPSAIKNQCDDNAKQSANKISEKDCGSDTPIKLTLTQQL